MSGTPTFDALVAERRAEVRRAAHAQRKAFTIVVDDLRRTARAEGVTDAELGRALLSPAMRARLKASLGR